MVVEAANASFSDPRNCRTLLGFFSRPASDERKRDTNHTIDLTVPSMSEGSDDLEGDQADCVDGKVSFRATTEIEIVGGISRAVSYLKRRSLNRKVSNSLTFENVDGLKDIERVDALKDIFSNKLNECHPDLLPKLREKREQAPIVCYESDDEAAVESLESASKATSDGNEHDPALMARLEALEIQKSLLGMNHPDVNFLIQHISRSQCRRRNGAVLGHSRSLFPYYHQYRPSNAHYDYCVHANAMTKG